MKGDDIILNKKLLNANEVAVVVGISIQTLNNWYRWKKINPTHEYARLLPKYQQVKGRSARLWSVDDINSLVEFKQKIPHGRNGILGDVTQKRKEK